MKKLWNILLSLTLVVTTFSVYAKYWEIPIQAATCSTVEECEAQKAEIEAKKKDLQSKIDAADSETEDQMEAIYAIEAKKEVLESEIALLNESIIVLRDKENQMTEEIASTEDLLLERIKVMQRDEKQFTFFSLLVTSTSLTEMMRKWRWMELFNKDDAELVNIVVENRKEVLKMQELQKKDVEAIEVSKAELENSGAELKKVLANMITKKAELESKMADINISAAEIDRQKADAEAYREELQKEEEEANKPAPVESEKPSNPDNGNSGNGGGDESKPDPAPTPTPPAPKPPVQSWTNPSYQSPQIITCKRYCYNDHLGVDFGVSYQDLLAIAPGRVLMTSSGWSGGFGNMVVLYHYMNGTDYISIYAHMSSIGVVEGQRVASGQYLGVSGNTGQSFGAHLHLELVEGIDYYPGKDVRRAYGVDVTDYIPGRFTYWDV